MNDKAVTKSNGRGLELRDILLSKKAEIQKAAGAVLDAEYLIRIAFNAIQKNSLLMECTPASVVFSVMDAASYGLVPNSLTNEGHLIPFYNNKDKCYEAVFMPGYKGLIKIAMNTDMVDRVDVRAVYENDQFDYCYGLEPKLVHKPANGVPGNFIGAYAVVAMKRGGNTFEYLTADSAMVHADRFSKAKDKKGKLIKAWKDDFPAMTMKTVLKKALKYCPASQKSEKLNEALARDDINESGNDYSDDGFPVIPEPQETTQDPVVENQDELTGEEKAEIVEGEKEETAKDNSELFANKKDCL